jgi:hypothetical protein
MLISDALGLVFAMQEEYLRLVTPASTNSAKGRGQGLLPPKAHDDGADTGYGIPGRDSLGGHEHKSPPKHLTETEARTLTNKIKAGVSAVSVLLLEAHDRRAWSVLGYDTWEEYVRGELNLSRSRSYELLDHAVVMRSIQAAAEMSGIPDISAHCAAQIKPGLPEIVQKIHLKTRDAPDDQKPKLVREMINEARLHLRKKRAAEGSRQQPARGSNKSEYEGAWLLRVPDAEARVDLASLYAAIDCLAMLPSVRGILDQIPTEQADRLANLSRAVRWLTAFSEEWSTRDCSGGKDAGPLQSANAIPAPFVSVAR